jgi:hypothetical protein
MAAMASSSDGKAENDDSGRSVSSAGDVNGDGIDDLIVGAPNAEPDLPNDSRGQSYVVFGVQGNRPSARVELASLDGTEGFAISGIDGQDQAGTVGQRHWGYQRRWLC